MLLSSLLSLSPNREDPGGGKEDRQSTRSAGERESVWEGRQTQRDYSAERKECDRVEWFMRSFRGF